MNPLNLLIKKLPPSYQGLATHVSSFVIGLVVAVVLNYVMYRLGLPSKPFIYVAF